MQPGIAGGVVDVQLAVVRAMAPLVNTTLDTSPTRSAPRGAINSEIARGSRTARR